MWDKGWGLCQSAVQSVQAWDSRASDNNHSPGCIPRS